MNKMMWIVVGVLVFSLAVIMANAIVTSQTLADLSRRLDACEGCQFSD